MTRILVVEDEPAIALGLEDDLRMEGYEVEVVRDGVRAARRALDGRWQADGLGQGRHRSSDAPTEPSMTI